MDFEIQNVHVWVPNIISGVVVSMLWEISCFWLKWDLSLNPENCHQTGLEIAAANHVNGAGDQLDEEASSWSWWIHPDVLTSTVYTHYRTPTGRARNWHYVAKQQIAS